MSAIAWCPTLTAWPPPWPRPIWSWRARAARSPSSPPSASRRSWCRTPYATADHQRKNAREMVAGGAALLVDDAELSGALLGRLVAELLGDRERLAAMAAASAALGRPDAARRVADQVEDILTTRRGRGASMSHEARDFPQPVHFIGIGGAGMSGIAAVLHELGVDVTRLGPQGVPLHASSRRGGGPRHGRDTTPPTSATPPWSSRPRPSPRATPSCAPRTPPDCPCSGAPRCWLASWSCAGVSPWPAPTARRRRRR